MRIGETSRQHPGLIARPDDGAKPTSHTYSRPLIAIDVSTGRCCESFSGFSMCFWISSHSERSVISLMANLDSLRASSTRTANSLFWKRFYSPRRQQPRLH